MLPFFCPLPQVTSEDPKRQTVSMVLADTILVVDKPREDGSYARPHTRMGKA